eukprot:SAG31_NODE_2665_length_5274_cov_25.628213_2_plen_128_part_00
MLHVTPEAAVGGPLGLVRDGDMIQLDVIGRKLQVSRFTFASQMQARSFSTFFLYIVNGFAQLLISDEELQQRSAAWKPRSAHYGRGFGAMYSMHVTQARTLHTTLLRYRVLNIASLSLRLLICICLT